MQSSGQQSSSALPMEHFLHLDAARGIASIVVLLHHFSLAFVPQLMLEPAQGGIKSTPIYSFVNAELAIYFFFVLSGFVLTFRFYQEVSPLRLLSSVAKRLPRLWLPIMLSILLGWAILRNGGAALAFKAGDLSGSGWLLTFGNAFTPSDFSASLMDALHQSIIVFLESGHYYYNSNLWTMVFEFWGSLLVFFIIFIVYTFRGRFSTQHIMSLHILLFVVLTSYGAPQYGTFLAGSALSFLMAKRVICFTFNRWLTLTFAAIFMLGACSFSEGPFAHLQLISAVAAMLFLFSISKISNIFWGRTARILGQLSFPLYLVHTLVILGPGSWLYLYLAEYLSPSLVIFMTFVAVLCLSLSLALPLALIDHYWTNTINHIFRLIFKTKKLSPANLGTTGKVSNQSVECHR